MPPPRATSTTSALRDNDVGHGDVGLGDVSLADVGLGAIVAALLRRWLIVGVCLVACIGLGVAYIVTAQVRYTASASILLDPRLGKTVGADPSLPGFSPDANAIDSQIRLLTSQTVLSRVATTLHLDQAPEFSATRGIFSRLFGSADPSATGTDLVALDKAITIKKPERTYLIEIQASAATADRAAAIANAIADAYNEDQISSRVVAARNESKFVAQKREQLRKQVEEAETRIEAYKRANNIVSSDGLRSNEQQVSDLTRELGTARGRLSEFKARADQINAVARSGRIDSSAEALKSPAIERLRGTQAETERELARLSETLGPKHPARLEAQAQVQRVRDLIAVELGRLKQAVDNDYQAEKRTEVHLVEDLDRIKRQATDSGAKLVPLRQMERDVDALRASDERFSRVSDTLTQQEGDTPPARVIAAARPPVSPSWPRRSLILALATGVGLFFGLGAALFVDAILRPGARRQKPMESAMPEPDAGAYWHDDLAPPVAAPSEPSRMAQIRSARVRDVRVRAKALRDDDDVGEQPPNPTDRRPRGRRLVWS